jgi:hypothetical protein
MAVQEIIIQVDSKEELMKYLNQTIPIALNSIEEIAIKTIDRKARKEGTLHLPTWHGDVKSFPIIRIGGWYRKEYKDNSYFNGWRPWETIDPLSLNSDASEFTYLVICHILSILEKNEEMWRYDFLAKEGDGYNQGFNEMDGSVGIGYQISSGHNSPDEITISLVHFYYGK